MHLYERILSKLKTLELLPHSAKMIAGVSGGADSVVLLYLLHRLQAEFELALHVVHVNHQLRGKAAEEDAQFVEALATDLQLTCHIVTVDAAVVAQGRKLSIEHAARVARYTALAEVAQAIDARVIALAHNADDQAETVLLNLVRGAGSAGLRGMQSLAPLSDAHLLEPVDVALTLFRPLLDVPRSEIEAYCTEHNLEFRTDASNTDLTYRRNRLRHEIIPVLETLNPDLKAALSRAAAIISVEHDYLRTQTTAAFQAMLLTQQNAYLELDLGQWQRLPLALQRTTLRHAIETVQGSTHNVTFDHLEQIAGLAQSGITGARIALPGNLICRIGYGKLIIKTSDSPSPLPDWPLLETNTTLLIERAGRYALSGSTWQIEITSYEGPRSGPAFDALLHDPWSAILDAEQAVFPLAIRTRQPGDRFRPQGAGGSQKISDFMINAKIPAAYRDNVPLLFSADRIVWVCGWRVAEPFIVTEQTQEALLVRFVPPHLAD